MNTLPKTIMACIDLSDYSPMTLGYALELAKGPEDKVVAFSVVHNREVHPLYITEAVCPYQVEADVQVSRFKEHQASKVANLIKTRFPDQADRIQIRVDTGFPADMILSAVHRLRPDLVVMANKGRSNLSRFMLGSAAERVFRRCPVPLVSVRDKTIFRRRHAGDAKPKTSGVSTIVAAVDFSPWTDGVLEQAGWFARTCGAKLRIVNCISQDELDWIKTHFTPRGSFSVSRFLPQERERRKALVAERLGKYGLDELPDLKVSIDSGIPFEQILAAVDTEDADLLVLGPRGRNRSGHFVLGSTVEKLFRHCPVPVVRLGPDFKNT